MLNCISATILPKSGTKRAEHAGLVHLAQDALDIGRRGQDLEEPGIGLAVVAQVVADQLERAADGLDGIGVEVHVVPPGQHEPP